jgi:DNA-binding CsgD family transcriptional regulator
MAKPTAMMPQDAAPRCAPSPNEEAPLKLSSASEELVRFSLGAHTLVVVKGSATACDSVNGISSLAISQPYRVAGCVAVGGEAYTIFSLEAKELEDAQATSDLWSIRLLSQRELQIAALVMQGKVNKQIAHYLHIAPNTVQSHLKRIFCKLGVSSRAEMVAQLAGCLLPTNLHP